MAIKKRLSESERLRKQLPKGWRRTLNHPLMKKIIYNGNFDPQPRNVVKAIRLTKGWRGASYTEKLFVLCLDLLMEKVYGEGILDVDTYNRLQDHMQSNQAKMQNESLSTWMVWSWDYYHDHCKLFDIPDGSLELSTTVNVQDRQHKKASKRKRLKKHK